MAKKLSSWERYARAVGEEFARLATQELRGLADTLVHKRAKRDYKKAIKPATFAPTTGITTLRLSQDGGKHEARRVAIVELGQPSWDMKKSPAYAGPFGLPRTLPLEQKDGSVKFRTFSPLSKNFKNQWNHPGVEAKHFMRRVKAMSEELFWEAIQNVTSGESQGRASRKWRSTQADAKAAESASRTKSRRK